MIWLKIQPQLQYVRGGNLGLTVYLNTLVTVVVLRTPPFPLLLKSNPITRCHPLAKVFLRMGTFCPYHTVQQQDKDI